MKKMRLPLLLAIGYALLLPALAPADTVVEEIITRVNNEIITRSEYVRSRDQLKQEVQQQDPTNADKVFAEKQRDVLRDLIDQQLLLQKGKDLGITGDTELIKRLDEMRKQMNLGTMEELEKAAEAQGASYEEFKQNLRNQIITQKVIGDEVGSQACHEQGRCKEVLRAAPWRNGTSGSGPFERNSGHAEVPEAAVGADGKPLPVSDADTQAALDAAKARAEDLLDQLHKGAKFADLAKKSSDGPSAQDGGDLREFNRGTLSKDLEDKVFALKAGETTDVIRTKQGYVILEVTEHQSAGIPTLKEVEPRIQDALYMQRLQPALRAYLTTLREEAYIDYKNGYVDTGASTKQTKPVETTSKEEKDAKKLKKKKKLGVF